MINITGIHEALVRLTSAAVGSQLSATVGAVIKETQGKQAPRHPYIVISYPLVKDESGWQLEELFNEDDELTSITIKHLAFTLVCYGNNSVDILNNLQGYLRRASVRDSMREDFGAGILAWSDVRPFQRVTADKNFVQTAEFVLTINVPDVDTITGDDNNHLIQGVDLAGELFRHESDSDPLDIDIEILP